jgi:hypothetical protein
MSRVGESWFLEQRVSWIRECVQIIGFVRRSHIMHKFNISERRAADDIAEVIKRFPDLMRYDSSAKAYVAAKEPDWPLVGDEEDDGTDTSAEG